MGVDVDDCSSWTTAFRWQVLPLVGDVVPERGCWRRVVSVQEHKVSAEAVPDWASEVSATVPLCRKHETKFDTSEIKQQFIDRFGGRDNPA